MKVFLLLPLLILVLGSCSENKNEVQTAKSIGDQSVSIFKDQALYFSMEFKDTTQYPINGVGIKYLDAGRLILKKVALPSYERDVDITLNMQLVSAGDPWDKYGSVFILPKGSTPDFVQLETKQRSLPSFQDSTTFGGIIKEAGFLPALEVLRFNTPFGIGYYSDTLNAYKPVYIPKWEKEVQWSQNLSHLQSELEDSVWIGVIIDTWTAEGYQINLSLEFTESSYPISISPEKKVVPLFNTTKYLSHQNLYDHFSKSPLTVSFELPDSARNVQLHLITTGHGGHSTGDEFTPREHILTLDGAPLKTWTPWRDDCASFRRFNPSSGVWTETIYWQGDSIKERIASSDYSRSNWCPGSQVDPLVVELKDIAAGAHQLSLAIPEAQAIVGDYLNHWMVSAYITYDLDAIEYTKK